MAAAGSALGAAVAALMAQSVLWSDAQLRWMAESVTLERHALIWDAAMSKAAGGGGGSGNSHGVPSSSSAAAASGPPQHQQHHHHHHNSQAASTLLGSTLMAMLPSRETVEFALRHALILVCRAALGVLHLAAMASGLAAGLAL